MPDAIWNHRPSFADFAHSTTTDDDVIAEYNLKHPNADNEEIQLKQQRLQRLMARQWLPHKTKMANLLKPAQGRLYDPYYAQQPGGIQVEDMIFGVQMAHLSATDDSDERLATSGANTLETLKNIIHKPFDIRQQPRPPLLPPGQQLRERVNTIRQSMRQTVDSMREGIRANREALRANAEAMRANLNANIAATRVNAQRRMAVMRQNLQTTTPVTSQPAGRQLGRENTSSTIWSSLAFRPRLLMPPPTEDEKEESKELEDVGVEMNFKTEANETVPDNDSMGSSWTTLSSTPEINSPGTSLIQGPTTIGPKKRAFPKRTQTPQSQGSAPLTTLHESEYSDDEDHEQPTTEIEASQVETVLGNAGDERTWQIIDQIQASGVSNASALTSASFSAKASRS